MARNNSSAPESSEPKGRIAQVREAYRMTRKVDRWVGFVTFGFFMTGWGLVVGIGAILGPTLYFAILGLPLGLIVALVIFGRRVERAAYAQVEGQPGAAAAVIQNARGWTVTPAVAANRNQDLVHRAVGRGGVVLIGEGNPQRVASLIVTQRKTLSRLVPDAPVTEMVVGDSAGQVPLSKVQRKLQRLPKVMRPAQVTETRNRLNALGGLMDQMPLPKGPIPGQGKAPRPKRR